MAYSSWLELLQGWRLHIFNSLLLLLPTLLSSTLHSPALRLCCCPHSLLLDAYDHISRPRGLQENSSPCSVLLLVHYVYFTYSQVRPWIFNSVCLLERMNKQRVFVCHICVYRIGSPVQQNPLVCVQKGHTSALDSSLNSYTKAKEKQRARKSSDKCERMWKFCSIDYTHKRCLKSYVLRMYTQLAIEVFTNWNCTVTNTHANWASHRMCWLMPAWLCRLAGVSWCFQCCLLIRSVRMLLGKKK